MQGTVKWFNKRKGFGFITTSGGNEVFFHKSELMGNQLPQQGQEVSFIIKEGDAGPEAARIEIPEPFARND